MIPSSPLVAHRRHLLDAFDEDHVRLGGAVAHFARFAVFLAVQPFFGAFHRFELKHDNPFRIPIAFQHFGFAAAGNILTAVVVNGRRSLFLVFFVADGIDISISTTT